MNLKKENDLLETTLSIAENGYAEALLAPGAHSRFGSGKNSQFKPER